MITCHKHHLYARFRERGYTLNEVMPCVVAKDGDQWTIDPNHPAYPLKPRPKRTPPPPLGEGPGTELKALLKDWLGIESSPTCRCNAMARKMNAKGIEWSLGPEGMAEILAAMQAEHAKRKQAGQTRLPWTDFGARKLVELACSRAKSKAEKEAVQGGGAGT